jgi:site-specific recombinase XerD
VVGGSNPLTPTIIPGTNSAPNRARPPKIPKNVNKKLTRFTPDSVNTNHPYWQQLFCGLIKRLHDEFGLSQHTLALGIGITPSYLSQLVKGKRRLTPPVLVALEDYLFSQSPQLALHFLDPFYVLTPLVTMEGEEMGIREVIEQFLVAKEVEGKTPATLDFYRDNLGRFHWWLEVSGVGPELRDITTATIRAFLGYVKNTPNRWQVGSTSSRKLPTMSTVDAYWRTLQSLFSWLIAEETIIPAENPLRKVPRPKVPRKIVQDIPLLLIRKAVELWDPNTFRGARNIAIILIFLDTGIRLGEMAGIRLRDLNLAGAIITVFGKGQKERKVRLEKTAFDALRHYLGLRPSVDSDYLWLTAEGKRFTAPGIQTFVRRLSKLGGNVRWSPHTFRNTFSMNYLRAGGDTFTLMMYGGWEDLEMPRLYTMALRADDAFEVHRRASPANQLFHPNDNEAKPED